MIGLSGQLGVGGLGAFPLATVRVGQPFVPHRRARSALSSQRARSVLASGRARSSLTAATVRSEVSVDE